MRGMLNNMADMLEQVIEKACEAFCVPKLFQEQRESLQHFILRKDVFLNLPTGFGKSLVFQMAPFVHAELSKFGTDRAFTSNNPIVIVISPLISLMQDQTAYLRSLHIKASYTGEGNDENLKIENGGCNLVYTSPESLLGNSRWRKMLSSDIYQKNLIGIAVDEAHCISHWGTSKSQEAMAFKRWFYKLSELRSLVPKNVAFMAVTATTSKKTRDTSVSVLRLRDYIDISQSPNKANIAFAVQYMNKQMSLSDHFRWFLQNLKENKASTDRTIIYCQTVKQCSTLYSCFANELGDALFSSEKRDQRERLVEMLHSLSSRQTKEVVLDSLSKEDGCIRVLICTIAYGMGVNCKGVNTVIHFGPSKTVEAYIQESGRAGRDGRPSKAILLYQSLMLLHVEKEMKDYVKGKYDCRRQFLMRHFQDSASVMTCEGVCCDLCSKEVDFLFPGTPSLAVFEGPTRCVSAENKKALKSKLVMFKKSTLLALLSQAPKGKVPIMTVPELVIGFSDVQIMQVLENSDILFSVSDINKFVKIWKEGHAYAILNILQEVFGDIDLKELRTADMEDMEEEDGDDWIDFLNDQELHANWDELSYNSVFQEDDSFLDGSLDLGDHTDFCTVPEIVSGLIDKIQIE